MGPVGSSVDHREHQETDETEPEDNGNRDVHHFGECEFVKNFLLDFQVLFCLFLIHIQQDFRRDGSRPC